MMIQLDNEDNAAEVLSVKNINIKEDISSDIELMRSQFMFEKAIQRINYNVSVFSKGSVLTEEKFNASELNILPYALKDSSLIGVQMFLEFDGKFVFLKYNHNGRAHRLKGLLNEHIQNKHFDIVVKSSNPLELKEDSEENELYFIFNSIESFASRYLSSLQVVPIDPVAKTIQITFRGNNAQMCHDIALAVAEEYIEYTDEEKQRGSENILLFIDQQLDSLAGELRESKDSLMYFQRKSNMPDPEAEGMSLSGNISKLQDESILIDDEIRSLSAVAKKLKSEPNRLDVYRILPEMLGKSYEQALSVQVSQLHELFEKKEDLLYQITPESAELKALESRIQSKLSNVRRSISVILDRLYDQSKILKEKINNYNADFIELPEKKMEFSRLKNVQELNEKYFTLLTERKVLYAISDAGYSSNNRILSRPVVNGIPVSPNRKLIYSTFVAFGFIIGVAILFFRYLTFNEINMLDDLKKILPEQATILGGVPLTKMKMEYSQIIVGDSPKSMLAESMRKIRTNLSYIHPNYQTIAISSSISGEGKTFVALNLAGIIALSGKRTIVLDLDLRRPKIHLGFNVANERGMSGLIVNQYALSECIQKSAIEHLDFVTAGPIPPNPSELLLSNRFKEIVEELKKNYDVIIIDNPPIGLVSDGVRILSESDIPIYVFKSHYSKRVFAQRVKELFDMDQLQKLNVVLNGLKSAGTSSYGYGYGYGYGYYESDVKSFRERWLERIKNFFGKFRRK
jgi:capsular exopolysaccharide synthesis family protein